MSGAWVEACREAVEGPVGRACDQLIGRDRDPGRDQEAAATLGWSSDDLQLWVAWVTAADARRSPR